MITISPSKTGKSLVFTEKEFLNGLEVSRKIAALSLDPAFEELEDDERTTKIEETIAFAESQSWELYGQPDSQGFCKIRMLKPEEAEA